MEAVGIDVIYVQRVHYTIAKSYWKVVCFFSSLAVCALSFVIRFLLCSAIVNTVSLNSGAMDCEYQWHRPWHGQQRKEPKRTKENLIKCDYRSSHGNIWSNLCWSCGQTSCTSAMEAHSFGRRVLFSTSVPRRNGSIMSLFVACSTLLPRQQFMKMMNDCGHTAHTPPPTDARAAATLKMLHFLSSFAILMGGTKATEKVTLSKKRNERKNYEKISVSNDTDINLQRFYRLRIIRWKRGPTYRVDHLLGVYIVNVDPMQISCNFIIFFLLCGFDK